MRTTKKFKPGMEICVTDACYDALLVLLQNKISEVLFDKLKNSHYKHYIFNKKQVKELKRALDKNPTTHEEVLKFKGEIEKKLNKKRG